MNKILTEKQAFTKSSEEKANGSKIVLAGGCFDILHVGHITFLKNAQKFGTLFILLESDEAIEKLKGKGRPINKQYERAEVLSSISYVDYVVLLEGIKDNKNYDDIVKSINPDFLAISQGDVCKTAKEKQAECINAKIITVTDFIQDRSTSRLAKIIENYE